MDYRFDINERNQPQALMSMGHEALGDWLSHDIGNDPAQCQQLLQWVSELEQRQRTTVNWQTAHYDLHMDRDEVSLTSRHGYDETDQVLEDSHLHVYDDESEAGCGLDDFRELIQAWLTFIQD